MKKLKKAFALVLCFAMAFTILMPHVTAKAIAPSITVAFNATVVGKNITYNVGGTDVVVTLADNVPNIDMENGKTTTITIDTAAKTLSGITIGNTFNAQTMDMKLTGSNAFNANLTWSNGTLTYDADGLPNETLNFVIQPKNNGGGNPPQGNTPATITINGMPGSTTVDACVWEEWQQRNAQDQVVWDYEDSFRLLKISLNEGQYVGEPVSTDNGFDTSHNNFSTNSYSYNYTSGDVTLHVASNWSYIIEELWVNGTQVNIPVNYANETDWLNHFSFEYRNQDFSFSVTVPKPANDTYTIDVKARPMAWNECFIGNFLWSSDPRQANGDMYIGHSSLQLISAKYPENLGGTTFAEATIAGEQNVRPKENKTAKYITYGVDENTGIGEMVLPVGTQVTMRVAPEHGYQVMAFKINGQPLEADKVGTGDEVAVFTFTITPANFHLSADVEKVEDAVAPNSTTVTGGAFALGGEEASMSVGTARLDVNDYEATAAEQSEFAAAAGDGFTVGGYLDIDLFNTVYKGTSADTWDTQVTDLSNPAHVSLQVADGVVTSSEVEVIRKHGDEVTRIPATYNAATKTLEFDSDGFSTYAIASGNDDEFFRNSALVDGGDGNWYLFTNGEFNPNYTGLFCDANVGWWLVANGRVAFEYNDLYGDAKYGWWKITNGAVDFEYSDLYCSPTVGWWLVYGGAVNFNYNDLFNSPQYGWWKVTNGAVDFGYSDLYCSPTVGWWLVYGGAVNFDYSDLFCSPQYGWWKVTNGAVDFEYSDLYESPIYGWWLVYGGAVNFDYSDLFGSPQYGWWKVTNGTVDFGYSDLYCSPACGWWLVYDGAVNFGYSDLFGSPQYGWWKVNGGAVDFGYTGGYESPIYGPWNINGGAVVF